MTVPMQRIKDFAKWDLRCALKNEFFRGLKLRRVSSGTARGFALEMLLAVDAEDPTIEGVKVLAWERTEDQIFAALREAILLLPASWIRQHDKPSDQELTSGEVYRLREIHGETLEWEDASDRRLFWLGWIKTDGARVRVDNDALDILFDSNGQLRAKYQRKRNTTPIGTGAMR